MLSEKNEEELQQVQKLKKQQNIYNSNWYWWNKGNCIFRMIKNFTVQVILNI